MVIRRDHPGFTLLEAILALIMLAGVMVACLSMRSQSLVSGERLSEVHRQDRDRIELFHMLINGLLLEPRADPETNQLIWEGDHHGDEYRIVRTQRPVPNVIRGQVNYPLSEQIVMSHYEITYRDKTTSFLWHN